MTPAPPPPGTKVFTVHELTATIKELLEEGYPSIWVEGEVSNLARPASGHLYLTLKDEHSPIKAVLYRGVALRMRFDLRDGMRIVVRGRLTVYSLRGEYQLLLEEVHPKGVGPLELAFRQLKEKLSVKGYFAPERKKPLPRIPRRLALVTSPTGSAVRDVLEVLARRWPAVEVWVFPVHVQGDEAAPEIAAAIGYLNEVGHRDGPTPIDALILARGGGSLEDLWPFNEEVVAHAIYRSKLPVVSGIGHEDDLTIADLVADRRALTPTEAAERSVPDRREVLTSLERSRNQLRTLLLRKLELSRARLERLEGRPCLKRPLERVREQERTVDELMQRLQRTGTRMLERARSRLRAVAGLLEGLSPLNVLARGYTVTRRLDDLAVVQTSRQVTTGDWIVTELANGRIISRVESSMQGKQVPDE